MLGLHWDSSWLSCCCPELWRSCSIGSEEWVPLCTPANHILGGCWGGPTYNLTLGLFSCKVTLPSISPLSSPWGWALLRCLGDLLFVGMNRVRVNCPAFMSSWSDLPHRHLEGQPYCVVQVWHGHAVLSSQKLQQRRGKASSTALVTSGSALPPASGIVGGHLSPPMMPHCHVSSGDSSPMPTTLGLAHSYLSQQETMMSRQGTGLALPSVAALLPFWSQDQQSHLP